MFARVADISALWFVFFQFGAFSSLSPIPNPRDHSVMLIAFLGSKSVLVISSWLEQKQCRQERIYFSLLFEDPVHHGGRGSAAGVSGSWSQLLPVRRQSEKNNGARLGFSFYGSSIGMGPPTFGVGFPSLETPL